MGNNIKLLLKVIIHGSRNTYIVEGHYNKVQYCKILHTDRNWGRISIRCWIYKRYPIPNPNGWAMGFFCEYLWENWLGYKGTALKAVKINLLWSGGWNNATFRPGNYKSKELYTLPTNNHLDAWSRPVIDRSKRCIVSKYIPKSATSINIWYQLSFILQDPTLFSILT